MTDTFTPTVEVADKAIIAAHTAMGVYSESRTTEATLALDRGIETLQRTYDALYPIFASAEAAFLAAKPKGTYQVKDFNLWMRTLVKGVGKVWSHSDAEVTEIVRTFHRHNADTRAKYLNWCVESVAKGKPPKRANVDGYLSWLPTESDWTATGKPSSARKARIASNEAKQVTRINRKLTETRIRPLVEGIDGLQRQLDYLFRLRHDIMREMNLLHDEALDAAGKDEEAQAAVAEAWALAERNYNRVANGKAPLKAK